MNNDIGIFLPVVVAHAFNPSTWDSQAGRHELEVNLVYRASSRTERAVSANKKLYTRDRY